MLRENLLHFFITPVLLTAGLFLCFCDQILNKFKIRNIKRTVTKAAKAFGEIDTCLFNPEARDFPRLKQYV